MSSPPPAPGYDPARTEARSNERTLPPGTLSEHSDEELMALLQGRELAALEALYDRHHRIVLALAYRVLGDVGSAEDVVQETFLSAWRHSDSYRPERGRARSWLLSIARHRAIDRVRRSRARGEVAELDPSAVDPNAADVLQAAEANDRRERILRALATLSSEQRQAVELAYYGGLTHLEISQRTGLPLGTVKGRLRLAMEKLRLALADLAPEIGGAR